jgi:hypothetical protein
MPEKAQLNKLWPLFAISAILYAYFAYFLERTDTAQILTVYTLLFAAYAWTVIQKWAAVDIKYLMYTAIAFRVLLVL